VSKPKGGKRYEKSWNEVLAMTEQEIAAGHGNGSQILARVGARIDARGFSSQRFRDQFANVGIAVEEDALPGERLVVQDGAYRIVPFERTCRETVITTLRDYIVKHRTEVDCVVELGSGHGRNLFDLSVSLREQAGIEVPLHACELTDSGRAVTTRLRDLSPGLDLSVHAFDYFHPDLSFLTGLPKVLFFTVFSIEQITLVNRAVIDEMLARTASCTCFHFEPVGWQYDQELRHWRQRRDTPISKLWSRSVRRIARASDSLFNTKLRAATTGISLQPEDVDSAGRVSKNAARWSERMDYNKNLVSLLHELEREKRIAIEREDVNVYGDNPFNPASILQWQNA